MFPKRILTPRFTGKDFSNLANIWVNPFGSLHQGVNEKDSQE